MVVAQISAGRPGGDLAALGPAIAGKVGEGGVDAAGGEVAGKEVSYLGAGEPVGGGAERGVDLFGDGIGGGVAHGPGGRARRVVP